MLPFRLLFLPELSFLKLIHLDLSANRISVLPVELRFITSLVELSVGENPLTCPPANVRKELMMLNGIPNELMVK